MVNSVSKSFAMTGWRIGYMAGPDWLVKACSNLQGQVTSGVNSIAQMAATEALNSPLDETIKMKLIFQKRRDIIVDAFRNIEGIKVMNPQGAFYLFPDISALFGKTFNGKTIKNADDMMWYLLDVAHVATVSGIAFGTPECIRLSYATSEENIIKAMTSISKALY